MTVTPRLAIQVTSSATSAPALSAPSTGQEVRLQVAQHVTDGIADSDGRLPQFLEREVTRGLRPLDDVCNRRPDVLHQFKELVEHGIGLFKRPIHDVGDALLDESDGQDRFADLPAPRP